MMLINTYYNGIELYRGDKIIYGKFLKPHQVISTCRAAGGIHSDFDYVLNSQGCEPTRHNRKLAIQKPLEYRAMICTPHGLPPKKCATMGTAANMNHAAFVVKRFRNLEVIAVVTGGVETNAGRAGDPASVFETENGFEKLVQIPPAPSHGTINIMLFISQPLTEAALTRTIMMATEAKSAALQELAVNSRYSDTLATGTGTDQIIVAAQNHEGFRLSWAGKHGKLGELIGLAVKDAVQETLAKQNSLTPMGQCSAKIHLERFGCSKASMVEGISQYLTDEQAEILQNNFIGIIRDPLTVAAVAALVHIRDKFTWGILPYSCWPEIIGTGATQIASSVAGNYENLTIYRQKLSKTEKSHDNDSFLTIVFQAFALGFADKWPAPSLDISDEDEERK